MFLSAQGVHLLQVYLWEFSLVECFFQHTPSVFAVDPSFCVDNGVYAHALLSVEAAASIKKARLVS